MSKIKIIKLIDITRFSSLDIESKRRFNEISKQHKEDFNKLVDKLSIKNANIDWWINSLASRNLLNSDLYESLCFILLVKDYINEGFIIEKIIVNKKSLIKIIKKITNNKTQIKLIHKNFYDRYLFYKYLFLIFQFFKRNYQFLICKFLIKKVSNPNDLTLIHTFAIPNFYNKDRYFNNFIKNIDHEYLQNVYFIPTLINLKISKVYHAYKNLSKFYNHKLFSKEKYLSFFDLIKAIFYFNKIKKIKISQTFYANIDISDLLSEESFNFKSINISIESMLNYFFIKNLYKSNYKIKSFIGWWENLQIDKSYYFSLNKFYPNTNTSGYLGYSPRNMELQLQVTDSEINFNVVPKNIFVIGDKIKDKYYLNNNKNINIQVAPAFRYSYLRNLRIKRSNNEYTNMLISLPVSIKHSIYILDMLLKLNNKINYKKFNYTIKPHPLINIKKLLKIYENKLPNNYSFTQEPLLNFFEDSDIVISSMSIVLLEAMSLGIPVIEINRDEPFDLSGIPHHINPLIWEKINNYDELEKSIEKFTHQKISCIDQYQQIGNEILKNYFEPINRDKIYKLLDIKN